MTEQAVVIARPYAQACFDYARDHNVLSSWQAELDALALCIAHPKIQRALSLPHYTSEQLSELLISLLSGVLSEGCERLVKLLAENKRLAVLPEIADLFRDCCRQYQQILSVEVTTAITVDHASAEALNQALASHFKKRVEVNYHVDKAVLGGVIVRAGDFVIDSSFAGQLKRLSNQLMA
ncbi:MAG: atpH [Gammaproteobacteria bacterium]|jgi:F-type H+-transporting ATPase subunit delta|nr:atpH [Gammaproteobacteria bacterium]